jgi:enamine deaminase RidA (YjgF/YER057c/UK114 family)
LRHCLEAAGSSLDHVLKVTTFLADLADFEAYNDVYQQYFSAPYPARTTVQADSRPDCGSRWKRSLDAGCDRITARSRISPNS